MTLLFLGLLCGLVIGGLLGWAGMALAFRVRVFLDGMEQMGMNFYDEAIEAKHGYLNQLVKQQQSIRRMIKEGKIQVVESHIDLFMANHEGKDRGTGAAEVDHARSNLHAMQTSTRGG